MSWEDVSRLRKDLGSNISIFQNLLSSNCGNINDLNLSVKEYERRINVSLELQYSASYIVSILYSMLNEIKILIRKGGTVSEQTQSKRALEDVNSLLEEYKNHVYTFSQRGKSLVDLLRVKQMANPEVYRSEFS